MLIWASFNTVASILFYVTTAKIRNSPQLSKELREKVLPVMAYRAVGEPEKRVAPACCFTTAGTSL